MEMFTIRSYGKSDLAMLYFPTANSKHVAVNHLNGWINRNKSLLAELESIGHLRSARYFTPKEVAIIVNYLGEP